MNLTSAMPSSRANSGLSKPRLLPLRSRRALAIIAIAPLLSGHEQDALFLNSQPQSFP